MFNAVMFIQRHFTLPGRFFYRVFEIVIMSLYTADLFHTSRTRPVEKQKSQPGSKRRKSKENTIPEDPPTKRKKITNNAKKVEKKTNKKSKFKIKKVEKLNRKPGKKYNFKERK